MKRMFVLLLAPSLAFAQSLGYADADNPGQALGMMKATIVTANTMTEECIKRAPQTAADNAKDLVAWETTESSVIEKTEWYWQKLVKLHPDQASQIDQVPPTIRVKLSALPNFGGKEQDIVVAEFCRQYFSELASGVWRVRTPNAYKWLDQSPGGRK